MAPTAKKIKEYELSILKITIRKDAITANISDGRVVSIPLSWFPKLLVATPDQLNNFKISPSGYGVSWPEIDEDISIKSFIS